jgi:hypothetical protein
LVSTERERGICKPVSKLDFTAHDIMEFLSEAEAPLRPFGPIEGHNWFSRFLANESLRRTGLHSSGKIQFDHPAFQISCSWLSPQNLDSVHCVEIEGNPATVSTFARSITMGSTFKINLKTEEKRNYSYSFNSACAIVHISSYLIESRSTNDFVPSLMMSEAHFIIT